MQTPAEPTETPLLERRMAKRHRFSTPITIYLPGGEVARGITLEINESGLSALTNAQFGVDETVDLDPVAGGRVSATVRRKLGNLYGFSFQNIRSEQLDRIRAICSRQPIYRSRVGI